jgi:GrpB-like predicted nucleotidyltransferase (UPF0157 family)
MIDKLRIVPYDPRWRELFLQLGTETRNVFQETAPRIDHIGSTSVPGLDAKPVIDIQISVIAFEPLECYRLPLESLGYVFRSQNPDRTKRYFRESPGQRRTHIHVRLLGSWSEQQALLFRDYLRVHPVDARRYAALKYSLAERYREDRVAYVDAKAPFIWEILQKANQWSQEVGWMAGSTDA